MVHELDSKPHPNHLLTALKYTTVVQFGSIRILNFTARKCPSQEIENITIQTITSMACSAEVDAAMEKGIAATTICTLPLADTSNFVSYSELTNSKFSSLYDTAKFSSKFKSAFPLTTNAYRLLLTAFIQ